MKKILSTILAMAMILSMGVMSFAASHSDGEFFLINEDGDLESEGMNPTLIPGKTYYIYLNKNGSSEPEKLKLTDDDCINYETDKKISFNSSSLSVTKKKLPGESTVSYFAVLKSKTIPASKYDSDNIILEIGDGTVTYKDDTTQSIWSDETFDVAYEENGDITEDPMLIDIDDTEDFDVENTDAVVTVNSEGLRTKMLVSCDTSYDYRFGEKYMNANMDFYSFNGATARKKMDVRIPMDGFKFIYERTDAGLKDITKADGKDFVFSTISLGKYVLSDTALPTIANPATPAVPPVTPTPGTQGPTGGSIPYNPGTGAAI